MEEEKTCRICLDSDIRKNLISPCLCSGTQKWVHRECLNKWRITREDRAFSKCTECLQSYTLLQPNNENNNDSKWGTIRFLGYCLLDLLLGLIGIFIITCFFSVLIYQIDYTKYIAKLFEINKHLYLFYYCCGVFTTLSIIGIFSSFMMCTAGTGSLVGRNNDCDCCAHCCSNCCRPGDIYYPAYVTTDPNCCCCCECCGQSASGGETCSLCSGFGSLSCGEEAFVFLLVGLAIFAIIGIFVSVFLGAMYIQQVTNKHIHFLHKKSLVKDYIVKDLAEDDESDENYRNDIELGHIKPNILSEESISSISDHNYNPYSNLINRDTQNGNDDLRNNSYDGYMTRRQREELNRLGLL